MRCYSTAKPRLEFASGSTGNTSQGNFRAGYLIADLEKNHEEKFRNITSHRTKGKVGKCANKNTVINPITRQKRRIQMKRTSRLTTMRSKGKRVHPSHFS